MKMNDMTGILAAAFLSFSCGVTFAEEQQNPVDCSTAQDDIAHLQHEKKSTDERKVKGVLAITPIGLITNAATSGDKDPNKEMQIDEYNQKIVDQIDAIKKACNIQ